MRAGKGAGLGSGVRLSSCLDESEKLFPGRQLAVRRWCKPQRTVVRNITTQIATIRRTLQASGCWAAIEGERKTGRLVLHVCRP